MARIFVSSPGAVTPFHMDHEHNFILQIRGNKKLYTWDPMDPQHHQQTRAGILRTLGRGVRDNKVAYAPA